MAWYRRAWRHLSGDDTTSRGGLPMAEALAPLPLVAIAVMVINDRLLKGSAMPELVTGKLSDFTGVFAFPLVAVAIADLLAYLLAKAGVPWDYTLRRWKLAVAIAFTAIVFAGIKLSPMLGGWVERAWATVVPRAAIYPDPTDVVALIVLAGTWWHGRAAIARGAHGRLAFAKARHAAGRPLAAPFADAARCGADPAVVAELDAVVDEWLRNENSAESVDSALVKLRA